MLNKTIKLIICCGNDVYMWCKEAPLATIDLSRNMTIELKSDFGITPLKCKHVANTNSYMEQSLSVIPSYYTSRLMPALLDAKWTRI
jgi:hypothetical protein